ncbi:MAG TPA: helix-turn-helix transcriptional regulator [Arachidicoccus sp.]|nr:helix-turn-helix transcriptional regulator [Arachidicoccus sp.]
MKIYFKENLAFLRRKFNKTQSEIASQVNKSQRIVSNWERDNTEPSLEEIGILSDFFGITSDELLFKNLESEGLNSGRNVNEPLKNEIPAFKKAIELHETTISTLKNSIEDKNALIAMLKSENKRLIAEMGKLIQKK